MKKHVLIAIFLSLISIPSYAFDITTPNYGGEVNFYESRLAKANRTGTPIRIGPTNCDSSCTLYLAARNGCVSPNAVFGFHAPWYGSSDGGIVDPRMVEQFARHYKPGLRKVFLDHVAKSGHIAPGPMLHITGQELSKFGYRLCPA